MTPSPLTPQERIDRAREAVCIILSGCQALRLDRANPVWELPGTSGGMNEALHHTASALQEIAESVNSMVRLAARQAKCEYRPVPDYTMAINHGCEPAEAKLAAAWGLDSEPDLTGYGGGTS